MHLPLMYIQNTMDKSNMYYFQCFHAARCSHLGTYVVKVVNESHANYTCEPCKVNTYDNGDKCKKCPPEKPITLSSGAKAMNECRSGLNFHIFNKENE